MLEFIKNMFTLEAPKTLHKIMPKFDSELENEQKKYFEFEFTDVLQTPDLELGFGPIVETTVDYVFVHVSIFEQYNVLQFIDSITYLIQSRDCKMNKSVFHINL